MDIGQIETSIGLDNHDRLGGAEKAGNVAKHQDWRTLFNSLVLCLFANVEPKTVLELTNAACGLEWDLEDLLKAGERGWNLKRMINIRLGLTRENDQLPKPFLRSYRDRPGGFTPEFEKMLESYYQARGWEKSTGIPSKEKLMELGLGWLAKEHYPEI